MKSSEKRLLILLVVIVLVSLPFWPIWGNDAEEQGDTNTDNLEQMTEFALGKADLPEIDFALLEAEKGEFTGSIRNLFVFGEAREETDVTEDDEETEDYEEDPYEMDAEETSEVTQEDPVARTLAGYEYLGYHITEKVRTAAFSFRNQAFIGTVGVTINDTFEIKQIDEDYVVIRVIEGDFEQRLKLQTPADPSGGN